MNKKVIIITIFVIILIIGVTIFFALNRSKEETSAEKSSKQEQNQEEQNQTYNIQTSKTNNSIGSESLNMNNQSKEIKINLKLNNKTFSATLNDNETVRQLISKFPMTIQMSDLHSNEKYKYLDSSLTTNSSIPRTINAGDIKLYGDNCLVIFYKNFSNSYSYTDLGKIDNVSEFVSELNQENVTITFELTN